MAFVYAVLGGGRQGTAAAYDMAKFGDASRILIADISLDAAKESAVRINTLIGNKIAEGHQVAVIGLRAVEQFRSPKGLDILGPGHFGFDMNYTPIEKLLG